MSVYAVNHITSAGEKRDSLHKDLYEARFRSDHLAEYFDYIETECIDYYILVDEYDIDEEVKEVLVENLDVLRYLKDYRIKNINPRGRDLTVYFQRLQGLAPHRPPCQNIYITSFDLLAIFLT